MMLIYILWEVMNYSLKNKKKTDILLGITLGTGIGFGLIINGQLFNLGN